MTMGKKLPVKQFEISTRREIAFPKPRYEEFLLPLKNKRDSCWKSNMFATEKKKNPQNKFALNIILVRKKSRTGDDRARTAQGGNIWFRLFQVV